MVEASKGFKVGALEAKGRRGAILLWMIKASGQKVELTAWKRP